jgi:DNA topoisomerase-1
MTASTDIDRAPDSAKEAGLHHASLNRAGITREAAGEHWRYRSPSGEIIQDERQLERIRKLVIPPAWTEVWICPDPRGHIQAVGLDSKGRKQYRYHPAWRAYRDETKFAHLAEFGAALPKIRERVDLDLAQPGFPRQKVLATIVKLLDASLIRIGNKGYERANGSYGLTTLRNRHVKVDGETIHFTFKGKGGIEHTVDLRDRRLARIVKRMRELPGYHVFQYLDTDGRRHDVSSDDVNNYLRTISGGEFTAKDFRTWAGTVRFIAELRDLPRPDSDTDANHAVVAAVKAVSRVLGNTPAVCRGSYIHPAAIDAYLDGISLAQSWKRCLRKGKECPVEELVLLDILKRQTLR